MLIRDTLLYLPAQIIGPIAQVSAIVVFTHWMEPGAYGVFTYVVASQEFVFLLCLFWWSQYTVRYLAGHAEAESKAYRDSEGTVLALTSIAQAVASVAALLAIAVTITPALGAATALYTATRGLNLYLGERARAGHRILDYTLAQTLGPVGGSLLAFILVARGAATPADALFGYGIVQAAVLMVLAIRQDLRFVPRRPDRALLRQAMAFGLPLIGAGLAAWFAMNAIRILVDREMGTAAMGLIAVGWNLGLRLTATAAMFVTVAAFPLAVASFRAGDRALAVRQITANGVLMFGLVLPAAVGVYLVQGPVVDLIVAAPFRATTLAILPSALAAGLCRNIRTHVVDQVFTLIEETSTVLVMTIAEAVLVVGGCALGIAAAGAVGAAAGSALGFGAALIVGFTVAARRTGLRVPVADAGCVMLAAAAMASAVLAVQRLSKPGGSLADLTMDVLLGALVYGVAILLLFPRFTRQALSRWRHMAVR